MPFERPGSSTSSSGSKSSGSSTTSSNFVRPKPRSSKKTIPLRAAPGYLDYMRTVSGGSDPIGSALGRWVGSPAKTVLDNLSRPAYAVGNLIQGKPGEALKAVAPLGGPIGLGISKAVTGKTIPNYERVLPGQALARRGVLPKSGWQGAVSRFAADVALDPLTYLTFGVGPTAQAVTKSGKTKTLFGDAAEIALSKRGDVLLDKSVTKKIAEGGGTLSLSDVGRSAVRVAKEREVAPRGFYVGMKVPFTRRKIVNIAGSTRVGGTMTSGVRKAGSTRPGEIAQELLMPAGSTSRAVHETERMIRGYKDARIQEFVSQFDTRRLWLEKIAKKNNIKPDDMDRIVAFHLDMPDKYPLPEGLKPIKVKGQDVSVNDLVDYFRERTEWIRPIEEEAGIAKAKDVPWYYPRMSKNPSSQRKFLAHTNRSPDRPFHEEARVIKDLEEWDRLEKAGYLGPAELNPFKALERRYKASFDAQAKKALDDAIAVEFGVQAPLRKAPDVGGAFLELDKQRSIFASLVEKKGPSSIPRDLVSEHEKSISSAKSAIGSKYVRLRAQRAIETATKSSQGNFKRFNVAVKGLEYSKNTRNISDYHNALANLMADKANKIAWDSAKPETVIQAWGTVIAKENAEKAVVKAENALRSAAESSDRNAVILARKEVTIKKRELEAAIRAVKRVSKNAVSEALSITKQTANLGFANIAATGRALGKAEGIASSSYVGSAGQIARKARRIQSLERSFKARQIRASRIIEENKLRIENGVKLVDQEQWDYVLSHWAEVSSPYHKNTRVPPEIRQALDRSYAQMDKAIKTTEGFKEIVSFVNKMGLMWKSLAVLSPGFHMRNMQDDSLRAFLEGARNPKSYAQSARILAKRDLDKPINLGKGRVKTGRQIIMEAEATNAIDGFVAHELLSEASVQGHRRVPKYLPGRVPGAGAAAKSSRSVGDFRENWLRLGTFIEMQKKGFGPSLAGRRVRNAHFDYGDVGKFVASARKFFFPFATFQAKSAAYIGRQVVKHPGQLANINKAMEESNLWAGAPDRDLLPVGQRLAFGIPWGGKPNVPMMFNPERTFYFGSMNTLDPRQIQAGPMSLLTPWVKTPIELASGKQFYNGQFFNKKKFASDRVVAPNWVQYLAKKGYPVPGYESAEARRTDKKGRLIPYKTDVVTKEPRASIPWSTYQLASLLPVWNQFGQATGGTSDDSRIGPLRYFLGLSVTPHDRARAQALAQIFSGR